MTNFLDYFENIPQFAYTWGTFFGAGAILIAIQVLRTRKPLSIKEIINCCVPFDPLRSKSFHMDLVIYAVRKGTDFIFFMAGNAVFAFVALTTVVFFRANYGPVAPETMTGPVAFLYIVIILVVAEFSFFLAHYLQHKIPFLWELHKVHHSADFLNPFTTMRSHPLGVMFKMTVTGLITAFPSGLFMFKFGLSLPEVILVNALSVRMLTTCTLDALRHSHFPVTYGPLDRMIMSPHMHHVHHSSVKHHWDKNFGTNLSVFDWIFGTAYKPAKDEEIKIGMGGYSSAELQEFNTLWGAYISPIQRSLRILIGVVPRSQTTH